MGSSRENQSIFNGKKLSKKLKILLNPFSKDWTKQYIITDSFIIPFNKKIGCRIFKHKWSTKNDQEKYDFSGYFCWKCNLHKTDSEMRDYKIKKII